MDLVSCQSVPKSRPNFVILIADDLGIGDVGAFGNTSLHTPNIDRIGREGALLTHHLTAASVCTPSRSAFLTGRYPVRTGMASPNKNRVFLFIAAKGGLPENETTFAKVLKKENYGTALIGKWHLGNDCHRSGDGCHHPLNHGFDYFYGIPLTNLKDFGSDGGSVVKSYFPYMDPILSTFMTLGITFGLIAYYKNCRKTSLAILFLFVIIPLLLITVQKSVKLLNSVLMRDNQVIEQPIHLEGITDRLVDETENFINKQVAQQKPFLVVLNFIKVHTAHFPSNKFKGKSGFGKYGDCVMEMDYGVGRVLDFLEKNNLKDNTFVYFSSDNGGHLEDVGVDGEQEGGFNGIYKGGKGHGAMEGGIRVPTAVMWPNRIPRNSVISVVTSQMDVFPTIHDILGITLPKDRIIDGKSILNVLEGPGSGRSPHKYLFHYCGTYLHGVRYVESEDKIWKLYYYRPKYKFPNQYKCQFMCMCFEPHVIKYDPPLLFNIATDPKEDFSIDINSNPKYKKMVAQIAEAVIEHKKSLDSVPSQFDFWNSVWRPWLQPCCKFPFCQCQESNVKRDKFSIEL